MNWLAGIESMVPTIGATTQAALEILSERSDYSTRTYHIKFGLQEPFKLRDRTEMVTSGSVVLNYAHHNFHTFAETFYEHPLYGSAFRAGRARGRNFRGSANRITQKLWNSECDRFRVAFLARDPVIHDTIRGAILSAMSKPFCSTCYNEPGECLCSR